MEILILKNNTAIPQIGSGLQAYNAKAKIRVENSNHAQYFINNFKGQHNYKEAFPVEEKVIFDVELEGANGYFWDEQIKPINWKPLF